MAEIKKLIRSMVDYL